MNPQEKHEESQRIKQAIRGLFPEDGQMRLREGMLRLVNACGQLPYVGRALLESLAAAKTMEIDQWEVYMYHSLNDAIQWLCKLETEMLDAGHELRFFVRKREQKRLEAEDRQKEAEWARQDGRKYEEHLASLAKREEPSDEQTGSDRGLFSGGNSSGGGGSGGSANQGGVSGVDGETGGEAGLVDPEGRGSGEDIVGEARRILSAGRDVPPR
jgi:uncharacterized membrane protein YgcG